MRIVAYAAVIACLSGCASSEAARISPVETVTCADPETRRKLGQGDTYRDLARAHAAAVAGWHDCYSAVGAARQIVTGGAL